MELNRAKIVDENFTRRVLAQDFPLAKSDTQGLDKAFFLSLFESQLISRHVDLMARQLREQQQGFYTIASSGHEGNAALGRVFRKDDIAFLHYRSGAFMAERARFCPEIDIIYDELLSLVASSDDPISGGRHKVFGSVPLWVVPQTSTIASHLPKAIGAALSISMAKTLKSVTPLPKDSIVLCSFGDASVNHSTAQGAFNAAQWIIDTHLPLPLVWLCEDNGIGISQPTPENWIEKTIKNRPGLQYIACDGRNLADVYAKGVQAEHLARKGQCVFLHMKTVRLLGHAGADIESQYHTQAQIEADESDDPLLHSARTIVQNQWLTPNEIVNLYEKFRTKIQERAKRATQAPKLNSAKAIMAAIIPPKRKLSMATAKAGQTFKNMAHAINTALSDILSHYPNACIFGEDVAKKGGVYHVTAELQTRFGPARVFDTILDEQTILGTVIGLAHNGFLPIPEIQFLAYVHNAADQIRGEAATLSFFSNGQYTNPMVVRIPGLAYQKGFGGHFHNDNAIAFLREIPGIMIACPSTPMDAYQLLQESVRLAQVDQRVVIFLEPIALYTEKIFESRSDEKSDVVILSYGNGMHLSRQVAQKISVKLVDLRWLKPLPLETILQEIAGKPMVLIVDECRKTGSLSEELISLLVENLDPLPMVARITAQDCFIPLGDAAQYVLPSVEDIITKIQTMREKHGRSILPG